MALSFPTLVCGLGWGDLLGGFVYAGILRIFFIQQATFCVNSWPTGSVTSPSTTATHPVTTSSPPSSPLARATTTSTTSSPRDYRNAIEWWQYDPTKWFIYVMEASSASPTTSSSSAPTRSRRAASSSCRRSSTRSAPRSTGASSRAAPRRQLGRLCRRGQERQGASIAVAGVIHDVTNFIKDHPGGKALISSAIGKDATAIFNGGVYNHSNAAHNLLSTMRVGVLRGGCEVEIWKRAQFENKDVIVRQRLRPASASSAPALKVTKASCARGCMSTRHEVHTKRGKCGGNTEKRLQRLARRRMRADTSFSELIDKFEDSATPLNLGAVPFTHCFLS